MLTLMTIDPCPSGFTPFVTLSCNPVTTSAHVTIDTALVTAVITIEARLTDLNSLCKDQVI